MGPGTRLKVHKRTSVKLIEIDLSSGLTDLEQIDISFNSVSLTDKSSSKNNIIQ